MSIEALPLIRFTNVVINVAMYNVPITEPIMYQTRQQIKTILDDAATAVVGFDQEREKACAEIKTKDELVSDVLNGIWVYGNKSASKLAAEIETAVSFKCMFIAVSINAHIRSVLIVPLFNYQYDVLITHIYTNIKNIYINYSDAHHRSIPRSFLRNLSRQLNTLCYFVFHHVYTNTSLIRYDIRGDHSDEVDYEADDDSDDDYD